MTTTTNHADAVRSLGLTELHLVVDWEYDCSAAGETAFPSRSAAYLRAEDNDDDATVTFLQAEDEKFRAALSNEFDRTAARVSEKLGVPVVVRWATYGEAGNLDFERQGLSDIALEDLQALQQDAYQEFWEQIANVYIDDDGSWQIVVSA